MKGGRQRARGEREGEGSCLSVTIQFDMPSVMMWIKCENFQKTLLEMKRAKKNTQQVFILSNRCLSYMVYSKRCVFKEGAFTLA